MSGGGLPERELDALVHSLDSHANAAAVGVEGSVYSGKSTLCAEIARGTGALLLEELARTSAVRRLIAAPWPADPGAQTARQLAILDQEAARVERARDARLAGGPLVLDRTLISPIAYLYARVDAGDARPSSLRAVVDAARERVEAGAALVPARLIYLSVDADECRRRLTATREHPPRATEPFLMQPRTIAAQRSFIEAVAARASRIAVEL